MGMETMFNTFKSTDSIECCEAGIQKTDFQGSGPISKKPKVEILASQNEDNSKGAERRDKFDDLPDCLLLHILSFMETKYAIRTCVLSKRWRYLWTSVPCLYFSSKSFSRLADFRKFVMWVLSCRDSSHVKVLIYCRFGVDYATDQYLLNKVIHFAASHRVEEIRINLRAKTSGSPPVEIPLSLFNCQSLKRLELKDCHLTNISSTLGCKSLERLHLEHFFMYPAADYSNPFASLSVLFSFTTLTTLHLSSFTLRYTGIDSLGPFVNCVNLKNLHLSDMCFKSYSNSKEDFVISAPKLNNLTLMCNHFKCKLVVAAPQLTNFSYMYSTPCAFFEFSIPSLDGLIIDIHEPHGQLEKSYQKQSKESLHGLINMFRGHQNAEAIELTFCTVAVTCGTDAMVKKGSLSFSKLKSLNLGVGSTYKIFINDLDNVTAYFRNCSQHADFDIVTV